MTVNTGLKPKALPTARIVVVNLNGHRPGNEDAPPNRPCWTCQGRLFWKQSPGWYLCQTCHPCPLEAEAVEWHTVKETARPSAGCRAGDAISGGDT